MEGTAINILDIINRLENNGKLSFFTVAYWARDYFYNKYSSDLSFPDPYFRRKALPYVTGLFFYHLAEYYGKKLYGSQKYGLELYMKFLKASKKRKMYLMA